MFYKYVIGYVRLSRDDKDCMDESNSIKNQKLLIQYFVEKNDEFKDSKIVFYVDDGYSGTSFNRPGFKQMMDYVQREDFCCIIVKDLSRFGRDTIDSQNYLEKVFPFLHVRFIAINDFYDSNTSSMQNKDTEVKFKNLINGIYPQICSKNIKEVMRKNAEMGRYHGAVPPFGYKFPEGCRTALLIDEEAAKTVRLIFQYFLSGKRSVEIARLLNENQVITPTEYMRSKGYRRSLPGTSIWTYGMVNGILKNLSYTGTMVNHKTENKIISVKSAKSVPREKWICVPGTHEAIISQEDFETAMKLFQQRKSKTTTTKNRETIKPVLHGKIKCGYCRRKVRIRFDGPYKNIKFYCTSVRTDTSMGCYAGGYNIAQIEEIVLALIRERAAFAEKSIKAEKLITQTLDSSKTKKRKALMERKIERCKTEKMELYEKYVAGELEREEYLLRKESVNQKSVGFQENVDEAEKILLEEKMRKERNFHLKGIAKYSEISALSRPIVDELIETIYFYDPEHIEVVWNFKDELLDYCKESGKLKSI